MFPRMDSPLKPALTYSREQANDKMYPVTREDVSTPLVVGLGLNKINVTNIRSENER